MPYPNSGQARSHEIPPDRTKRPDVISIDRPEGEDAACRSEGIGVFKGLIWIAAIYAFLGAGALLVHLAWSFLRKHF